MNEISLPARVSISDSVLCQEIEGESVLLDMENEQYFGLDDVGTQIWQLLAVDGDVAKVLEQLKLVYEVDENTLRTDLAKLVAQLNEKGLISIQGQ